MDEIRQEFLDIVVNVRTHLEYQRALGITSVETPSHKNFTKHVPRNEVNPSVPPLAQEGINQSLQKGSGGGFTAPSSTLDAVRKELDGCNRCKLCKNRKTIVFGEGDPKAHLVFIGEGPGQEEDQQGRPFVGAAGQLLTDIIVKGMSLRREEVYICNIVKCRPPGNRNPEPDEIQACEPFLSRQIQAIKPDFIVGLGNVAVKTILKTGEGITALRGKWKTFLGIPVMPTFHPAYLLRNPADKKLVWEDIKKVMGELKAGARRQ